MNPHVPTRQQYIQCYRKRAFATKAKADLAAFMQSKNSGRDIRVYWCPECHLFHLTSREAK